MLELLAQMLFELPVAGLAWLLQRFTPMGQQSAELFATFALFGLIAAACFTAWFMYLAV